MPNQLNKNKNKLKEKEEIRTAQEHLILAQQTERRRRFQKIAVGHNSMEGLLKETRQRLDLVEEAREEFLNLHTPREENPNGRRSTCTARNAEGARAWSDLFVGDILPKRTASVDEPSSSPNNAEVRNNAAVENNAGVANAGVENSAGVQNSARVQNNAGTQQHTVIMAGPKEKLPKFDGDEAFDPIRHCKTCEMLWRANGVMDMNEWVRQFPATLRGCCD